MSFQSSGQAELLSGVSLAIPIFRCYGHKASCQVTVKIFWELKAHFQPECTTGLDRFLTVENGGFRRRVY